jgi:hypothetical protein
MNNKDHLSPPAEQLARLLAAQLDQGLREMPHDISERLRAARTRAVAARRLPVAVLASGARVQQGTLVLEGGPDKLRFWGWMGTLIPLVALVLGLFAIYTVQNDWRADELASVDTALLTDELPPTAFTDPGVLKFVRTSSSDLSSAKSASD